MKSTQKKKSIIIVSIIALLSLLCIFSCCINPLLKEILKNNFNIVSAKGNVLIHFISVGHGDAIAINLPDNKIMLIDTGDISTASTVTNYIRDKVMHTHNNKIIDYLVLTHADADHIGGALRLLTEFDIQKIFLPSVSKDTLTYNNLMSYIENNSYDTMINTDGYIIENNYYIEFFGPLSYTDTNNSCPVIKFSVQDTSFLFTGDISSQVETDLIDKYGIRLDSDILKVAHHGSKYSTSMEFLNLVTPKYSVISCGNQYGHPSDIVMNNLMNSGSGILRTDIDGNIMFVVGEEYDVTVLSGNYTITSLSLDYRILICIIDSILMVNIVIIIFKKDRKVKNKRK